MSRTPSFDKPDLARHIAESTRFPPGWRTPYIKGLGTSPPPSDLSAVSDWFAERVSMTEAGSYIAGTPPMEGTDDEFRAAAFVVIPSVAAAVSEAMGEGSKITVLTEGTAFDPDTERKPRDESELVAATVSGASRATGAKTPSFDTWDDDPVNIYDPKSPVWDRLEEATGDRDVARAAIAVRMLVVGATVEDLEEVGILDEHSALRFEELTGRKVPKKVTGTIKAVLRRMVYPHEQDDDPTVVSAVSALYDSMRASNLLRKIHDAENDGGVAIAVVPPWMGYALKPVIARQNERERNRRKQASLDLEMTWGRKLTARKPSRKPLGDCYEAAFKFIMDECLFTPANESRYTLVHAEVMGQGPLEGTTFGHAFVVKDGAVVVDKSNGRNLEMPAFLYYAIGQISDIGNEHQYSWAEAKGKASKYKTYGPWDLKTRSGL